MKALFFGSIGSICDTSELQREAFNQAFREHGLGWEWDLPTYRRLLTVTGGQARILAYAVEQAMPTIQRATIRSLHEQKTVLFNNMLEQRAVGARPGVLRLLEAARQRGLLLGFITSTERANVQAIENALGDAFSLADFDIVTDRMMLRHAKPDPEAYLVALRTLGINSADACAIEDTPSCVHAAVAANITCIATPNGNSEQQNFDEAIACVSHLGDPDNPAKHIRGVRILSDDGTVTFEALESLLTTAEAS